MLDKIMDLVKGQVANAVTGNSDIPADKREETIQTTTHTVVDSLKSQLTPSNLGALAGMFGGGGSSASSSSLKNNVVTTGVQSAVVSALTSKVGLDHNLATRIATAAVPAIMAMFSKKVNDDKEPGFDLGSLVGSLTGGNKDKNQADNDSGNLMGMLGGLLGNKGK